MLRQSPLPLRQHHKMQKTMQTLAVSAKKGQRLKAETLNPKNKSQTFQAQSQIMLLYWPWTRIACHLPQAQIAQTSSSVGFGYMSNYLSKQERKQKLAEEALRLAQDDDD